MQKELLQAPVGLTWRAQLPEPLPQSWKLPCVGKTILRQEVLGCIRKSGKPRSGNEPEAILVHVAGFFLEFL